MHTQLWRILTTEVFDPDLNNPATGDKDLLRALVPTQNLGVYVGGRF